MKDMTRKNLRSDAALKRVLKEYLGTPVTAHGYATELNCLVRIQPNDIELLIYEMEDLEDMAIISLRDIIQKRKPLKGIKAVLSGKRKR